MRAYFYAEKDDISNMAELSRQIDREFNVEVEGGENDRIILSFPIIYKKIWLEVEKVYFGRSIFN